jgi:ubiquinone/menaquinone biosynthesis C-methylase UbiE
MMKTNYPGHDSLYKKLRSEGAQGWATEQEVNIYLALLANALQANYAPKSGKLLELGCGDGVNLLWLAERGYEVSGIDIAPTAIAWAEEKLTQHNLIADVRVGDVVDLRGYLDNFFDVVLDGHCLHCIIGEDRKRFLTNAFRVLKPGGFFHVCTMCGEVTDNAFKEHFDPHSRCVFHGDFAVRYIGQVADIQEEVRSAGFQIRASYLEPRQDENDCDSLLISATKA